MAQSATIPNIEENVVRLSGSRAVRNQTVKTLRQLGYGKDFVTEMMAWFDTGIPDDLVFYNSNFPERKPAIVSRPS